MAINSDEQQNAALSWTKAVTKNKEIVAENSNRLIPKGSKLNLKNPPRIKRKLSAWKGRTDRQAFWLKHNLIKKTLPGDAGEILDELKMAILSSSKISPASPGNVFLIRLCFNQNACLSVLPFHADNFLLILGGFFRFNLEPFGISLLEFSATISLFLVTALVQDKAAFCCSSLLIAINYFLLPALQQNISGNIQQL